MFRIDRDLQTGLDHWPPLRNACLILDSGSAIARCWKMLSEMHDRISLVSTIYLIYRPTRCANLYETIEVIQNDPLLFICNK